MSIEIRPANTLALAALKTFTDAQIGKDYYSLTDLQALMSLSLDSQGDCHSFTLVNSENEILGIRFTFPPGNWIKEVDFPLLKSLWNIDPYNVAYFKSLFIKPELQMQGWGSKLSHFSIDKLRSIGAKAIVCHAWVESPGNSSRRYLNKMGFQELGTHPHFWAPVDYLCSGCQTKPCLCTASEMILYL
ncbi:MAG: GNAT family N-acetyltransferase [Bdellovibrionales bacterium]|nr:GNAT family N-acetyltransferase [Bdellovibrionales bacterium]